VFITSLNAHMFHFCDGGHPGVSVEGRYNRELVLTKTHKTITNSNGSSPSVNALCAYDCTMAGVIFDIYL